MSDLTAALNNFGMTSQLIEHDLDRIEKKYGIDLGREYLKIIETDQEYYPQIEQDIRSEAAAMAPHYEVFYSLEKTVRRLITDTLVTAEGVNWWSSARIPVDLRNTTEERRQKEIDSAVTPRSDDPIDFCTFGELGEIIKVNWDVFAASFSSIKAVERVMANLNTLRSPIAHCSPLAEDEILRLRLTVRDWFRLME
ncbi:MAG: Swt1 family HEPN domain-containing protein [Candidatus Daviesbacteria bacterium]|nr:Swt1 family HEPN domain-containing protein [Candidatus Daviesbacteria bacterium]